MARVKIYRSAASPRTRLLLLAGGVSLFSISLLAPSGFGHGTQIESEAGTAVAILSEIAGLLGLSLQPSKAYDQQRLTQEAQKLAKRVSRREALEQQRFLADEGRFNPANVRFTRAAANVVWRTDGGDREGSLSDVLGFYQGLRVGRLVVRGAPGSGKTVLLSRLVCDLAEDAARPDVRPERRVLVPVRLSLSAFDSAQDDEHTNAETVSRRLVGWLASEIANAYQIDRTVAAALVEDDWILPVLDGLDEMDPARADPVKAGATVRALNLAHGREPFPVVVACRRDSYDLLAAHRPEPGWRSVLQDATVVDLEPLPAGEIAAYLRSRFPSPDDPEQIAPRWRPVVDRIGVDEHGTLARALSSPLRLFAAATAYADADTVPDELQNVPGDRLDDYLFSRLIPTLAATHAAAKDGSRHYRAEDVTRWLTTIAEYLRRQAELGSSESDFSLTRIWRMAGPALPRYLSAGILGALALAVFGAPYAWSIHTFHSWRPYNILAWALDAIALGLVAATVVRAAGRNVRVQRFDPGLIRTTAGRHRLFRRLGLSFAVGCLLGAMSIIAYGISFGVGFGIACTAVGVISGLDHQPSTISSFRTMAAQGITHDVVIVMVLTCSFGLANGFANQLIDGLLGGLTYGVAYGCAIGLAVIATSPWPRYLVATRMLARKGRLPARLAEFFDWAHDTGLLRLAGTSVQFRHRELQARLVSPDESAQTGQPTATAPSSTVV